MGTKWIRGAAVCAAAVLSACGGTAPAPNTPPAVAPSTAGSPAAASSQSASPAPAAPLVAGSGATLKIAYSQVGAAFAPLWMAQDEGLFKKYGADSEIVRLQPPTDTQALITGEVQIEVDGSSGVAAIAGGAPLTYIACPLPYYAQALYADPSIQNIGDLVGKTIGATTQGGSSDNALRTLLKQEGIDTSKINILYLRDDATVLASIQGKTVEGAILIPPSTTLAARAGFRELVDTVPLYLHTIDTGILVRTDWAQQHPDLVATFLKGYMEGSRAAKTKAEATKATIKKYTQLEDPTMLDDAYRSASIGWVVYPPMHDVDAQNVIDLALAESVKGHKPADFYDNSYVEKLQDFAKSLYPDGVIPPAR